MLQSVVYDSTALQFWGSELYEKGIPLQDEKSFFVNPLKSDSSPLQIVSFARQAAFYLEKTDGEMGS
jgi:hypothetical protein